MKDEDKKESESEIEENSSREIEDNLEGKDLEAGGSKEETLEDLAEEKEEEELPAGVPPSRPKSFNMDEEDYQSAIPHLNSSISSSPLYSNKKPSRTGLKLLLLVVIGLLVIGGVIYLLKGPEIFKGGLNLFSSPSPSPSPSTTPSPTPSPTPSFDRSKYKLRVLNGTPTTGLAASVSAKLKNLGYQIDKTGNASNSSFPQTLVASKSSAVGLVDQLIKDLSPDFSASASSPLKDSDSDDGEVTLGAK